MDEPVLPDGSSFFVDEPDEAKTSSDYLAEQMESSKQRWENPKEVTIDGEVIR